VSQVKVEGMVVKPTVQHRMVVLKLQVALQAAHGQTGLTYLSSYKGRSQQLRGREQLPRVLLTKVPVQQLAEAKP
jgi:hypothetical protein